MKFTARHAESWNQIPSDTADGALPLDSDECVQQARSRNDQMDEFCAEVGRDPATLRRSILAGGGVTPDNVWGSPEQFRDFVGRYREAGVDEFLFYYPSRVEQADGHYEHIAREVIPSLKEEAAS